MFYTGIGSRETPERFKIIFSKISNHLRALVFNN